MKKMVCEICESQKFKKENGVFVCQDCGTEYSLEEAKKLLIEVENVQTISESQTKVLDTTVNEKEDILNKLFSWYKYVQNINKCASILNLTAATIDYNKTYSILDDEIMSHIYNKCDNNEENPIYIIHSKCTKEAIIEFDRKIIDDKPNSKSFYCVNWMDSRVDYKIYKPFNNFVLDIFERFIEEFFDAKNKNLIYYTEIYNYYKELSNKYDFFFDFGFIPIYSPFGHKGDNIFFLEMNEWIRKDWWNHFSCRSFNADESVWGVYGKVGFFGGFKQYGAVTKDKTFDKIQKVKHCFYKSLKYHLEKNIFPVCDEIVDNLHNLLKMNSEFESKLFLPYKYRDENILIGLMQLFIDNRASTWKEAMNLFEEDTFRNNVLNKLDNIQNTINYIGKIALDTNNKIGNVGNLLLSMNKTLDRIGKDIDTSMKSLSNISRNTFITMWESI